MVIRIFAAIVFFFTLFLSPTAHAAEYYQWPLTQNTSGRDPVLSGRIDVVKYTPEELAKVSVSLYIAPILSPFTEGADPTLNPARREILPTKTASGPEIGINMVGQYFFTITNLTPGANYSYAHVLRHGSVSEVKVGTLNGKDGILTAAQLKDDLERRSYRLLAPFPGLSILLNPDLCLEMLAAGEAVPKLCTREDPSGVSSFLNYMLSLLIGLCAVMLVLRLVYEGYQYAVTDIPFLKASAKQNIVQAFLGLLIALSAYLILNTINPKLVDNNINLERIMLSVSPGEDGFGTESESKTEKKVTLKLKNGGTAPVLACSTTDKVRVNAFGTSFLIQKNLLPSIQRIDAKWRQLNPAYKIPMTVQDKGAMGGYVCRNARGMGKLSWHAYGLAVDINPVSNPAGKTLKTDMPAAFVKLWKDESWGWGGDWSSQKDAMHFSKGKNEGGDMTGE